MFCVAEVKSVSQVPEIITWTYNRYAPAEESRGILSRASAVEGRHYASVAGSLRSVQSASRLSD